MTNTQSLPSLSFNYTMLLLTGLSSMKCLRLLGQVLTDANILNILGMGDSYRAAQLGKYVPISERLVINLPVTEVIFR